MQRGHAVYQGEVGHLRVQPRQHGFNYPLALYWLDGSSLDSTTLAQCGISFERFGALSYRRSDYLAGAENLVEAVADKVIMLGAGHRPANIYILTPLANWGLYFSPLTLYYCFDSDGDFRYLLAEVTNTPWHEKHYYLHSISPGQTAYQHQKTFHVSPFHPMDMQYHWHITEPGTKLACSIRNTQHQQSVFSAWISLERHALTDKWRRRWLIRNPWQNVMVIVKIYYHAAKLLIKRIPLHAHPKSEG